MCVHSFPRGESPAGSREPPRLLPGSLNRPRSISEGNTTQHSSLPGGINTVFKNPRAIPKTREQSQISPIAPPSAPQGTGFTLAWGGVGYPSTHSVEQRSPLSDQLLEEPRASLRWRDSPAAPVSPRRSSAAPSSPLPPSNASASPNTSGRRFIWSRTFCSQQRNAVGIAA